MDRRTFLRLTTAAAAGVALGFDTRRASAGLVAGTAGFTSPDRNPRSSSLIAFGQPTRLALDYDSRSIGLDLGAALRVNALEVVTEGALNRLNSRDFSVYVSGDNQDWQLVDGVQFVELSSALWLYGFDQTTRYVKVHCHREELAGWTCVLANMQNDIRAHAFAADEFVGANGGVWQYRTPLTVQNPTSATLRDRAAYVSFAQLGTAALIAAGKLAADLRDLRFADATGRELHAYADASGVFVRIPQIAPSGSATVYAYSGNPVAKTRIERDSDALQVQYGRRAITKTAVSPPDAVKVAHLPTGLTVALNAAVPVVTRDANGVKVSATAVPVKVEYSDDGGRTWGPPEDWVPTVRDPMTTSLEGPCGVLWDPGRQVLTYMHQWAMDSTGLAPDYTDPTQRNVRQYIWQAHSFDSAGKPVWDPPRELPLVRRSGPGTLPAPVAWAVSYMNPILTSSGAYLYPICYVVRPDGTFVTNVVRSTDGGVTWTQSVDELQLPGQFGFEKGITEPGIGELPDGSILILARQQVGQKYVLAESRSFDDGVTWSAVQDSTVLSSNTQPAVLPDTDDTTILTWSGHNAYGQTSYFRNNLTVAYSDDNAATWRGYHDILAATSMSVPGWRTDLDVSDQRIAQNADSAAIGTSGDQLFSMRTPARVPVGPLVLVEDFERFIRDSHGALDTPHASRAAGTSNGSELADWRWWRTSPRRGTLDLVTGQRASRWAVRLRSSAGSYASASRLFPAIAVGRVRFGLKVVAFGAGIRLCLQEGFSTSPNARGTALSMLVTPSGAVQVTTDDTFITTQDCGATNNDQTPASGQMLGVGQYGVIGYDFQRRSIGADLFSVRPVTGIDIIDDTTIPDRPGGVPVNPANLTVWQSNDNLSWTSVSGWTGTTSGNVISLTGPSFNARYVKVAQPYAGTSFTITNDRQSILQVYPTQGTPQTFQPLSVPTTLTANTWYTVQIDVDIPADTMTLSINGQVRATLPVLHAAAVLTHLFVAIEQGPQAGNVIVDELLVQDTEHGLPAVTAVGATVPL